MIQPYSAVSSWSSLILPLFSPFTRIMSAWIPFGPAFQFHAATKTPQLLLRDALCLPQLWPRSIRKLLPRCCRDLRTASEIQLFQLCRLTQCLQKMWCSICSLGVFVEAPGVFCQNQSVKNTFGLQNVKVSSNSYDSFTNLNSENIQRKQIHTSNKARKPSTISLCEAPSEICLLQVEPLGTTNFLPRCCWDLRTDSEIQLFQLCRLAQGFKQICGAICSLGVFVEAPAVFCQH